MITTASNPRRRAWPFAACLLLAGCAGGTPPLRSLSSEDRRTAITALQAADARVANVAFRLASAGAAICPVTAGLTGLILHDASQYAPELRDAARANLGLTDRPGILAAARASPADKAGLRAGDAVVGIAGRPVAVTPGSPKARYDGVGALYANLEGAAAAGPFDLAIERGGVASTVRVEPVRGCASRVQLLPSPTVSAKADGRVLSVTTGLLDYVTGDDELALVIAHEMAHNALGHRAQLNAQGVRRGVFGGYGKNAVVIRATERAADRLAYFLMARAGYDPGVARAFWTRLHAGPADVRGPATTHPELSARITDADAAIADIGRARRAGRPLTP